MDGLSGDQSPQLSRLKINILGTWFATCIVTLSLAFILSIYLYQTAVLNPKVSTYQLYSALPESQVQTSDSITKQDGRTKIIASFFKGYNSVLANYSDVFIEVADQYNLDYRLLPAIAMQESNGGRIVPNDSYNPFGFGIYGSKILHFNSWDDGIRTVGQALRSDYLNKGLITPEQIMAKYTPPSLAKGGPWAKGVNSFMEELQ